MKNKEKNKRNIEIPKAISDLTDAEFMSFLYSERDREDSLSQWQGWNNWALAGAFVAVMWTAYSIWKNHCYVEGYDVIYYTSGIMAICLTLYSWFYFIKRERGIDFSKMRWLKEVFPYHLVLIALGCSLVFSLFIAVEDGYCYLFWLWSVMGILLVLALVSLFLYKDRVMPVYADGFVFPWIKANFWYYAALGSLCGPIVVQSFKKVSVDMLSNELEIAACLSICIVLFYIFLKLNTGNQAVKRLDIIIDDYIYKGIPKDKTYLEMQKNQMGYSVMDVCYNDLAEISDMMTKCEEDYKRLEMIKEAVEAGECIVAQFNELQKESKVFYDRLLKVMEMSRKLSDKLKEIQKVSVGMKQIAAINAILNEDDKTIDRINEMKDKMPEVVAIVRKRVDELKDNGGCGKN